MVMKLNMQSFRKTKTIGFLSGGILLFALAWMFGVIQSVALTLYSFVPVAIPGLPICPNCNVVIVALDVLRADDLPCYGYSRDTAPNMCAFAKKNAYFTRFYSESSYTLDTMASIVTGLYPSTHNMLSPMKDVLNPKIQTLTELLKAKGYTTIYGGNTNDPNLPMDLGFGRGFDEIRTMDTRTLGAWPKEYGVLFSKLTARKPAYILMHSYALHDPYTVGHGERLYEQGSYDTIPVDENDFYANSLPFYTFVLNEFNRRLNSSVTSESIARNRSIATSLQQAISANDLKSARTIVRSLYAFEQFDLSDMWYLGRIYRDNSKEIAYFRGLYDERLHILDQDIKPLLDFMSKPEIKRRTIFIITSPHGEEFMEHGELTHDNNIYSTSTYVPFIVSAPKIQQGAFTALGQGSDIFPTVLDMLGIKPKATLDGVSLLPVLLGKAKGVRQYVIGEHRGDITQSISDGKWKLYMNTDLSTNTPWAELYDVISDPGEKTNVLAAHLDESTRLQRALRAILVKSPHFDPVNTEFPGWVDELKRKKMIESGYF